MDSKDFENPEVVEFKSKYDTFLLLFGVIGFILCFVGVYNSGYSNLLGKDLIYKGIEIGGIGYLYFILTMILYGGKQFGWNILLNIVFSITVWSDLFYNYGGFVYRQGTFTFWFYPYIICVVSLVSISVLVWFEYNK